MLERLQSAAEENVGDLHGYWHERLKIAAIEILFFGCC
jgi:hypothetical protein